MVDASMPVASAIRRAARPVGATSRSERRSVAAAAQISRIVEVLPVPGPPVTTDSRDAKAPTTACHCSGAGTRSVSSAGLGGSNRGFEPASSRTRSASSASSAAVSARYAHTTEASSTSSASRSSSASSSADGAGPPRSADAARASSSTGRHVEPPFSASASTCCTAARARAGESSGTSPAARAIRSAVWKPTPNTLVRSYGRRRTTS
jgi:hypothetical protein